MKFARFADEHAKRVAVNPANVRFVREPDNPKGPTYIEFTQGRVSVSATFDDVVAALESAGDPQATAAPAVDPSDLGRAAKLLEMVSNDRLGRYDAANTLGLDPVAASWEEVGTAMRALANRLRGVFG